jgi:metallo-beta-lactamase class B
MKLTICAITFLSFHLMWNMPSALAEFQEDPPKKCAYCDDWNKPQEPFQIFGNTWYVGTAGLGAILVVTDEGLILIDGALSQSARLIVQNIRQLGFDPVNIKYLLNSHAHFDHAGGLGALQRYSDAKVFVSAASLSPLSSGNVDTEDPQYGFGENANEFPPVLNVSVIADGDSVSLGNTTLTAHYTPGHTPGGTTWTWESCKESHCLDVVYADSLSAVSAEDFLFSDSANPHAAQIRTSTDLISKLPCDILFAPHPFLIKMADKLETRIATPSAQPFIEKGACVDYANYFNNWLERRLAEELSAVTE